MNSSMRKEPYFVCIDTTRCNFHCSHCIRGKLDEGKTVIKDISVGLFEECLKEFKKLGYRRVAFTGGEPILHPEFDQLASSAAKEKFYFHIVSNGWFYEKYYPIIERNRKFFRSMNLSLDGASQVVHDAVRNKPGSFKKVIEAIEFYKNRNIPTGITTCFSLFNLPDAENIFRLLTSLRVHSWSVIAALDVNEKADYCPGEDGRTHLLEVVERLKKKKGPIIHLMASVGTRRAKSPVQFCGNISFLQPTVYPDGRMVFCCDVHKKCYDAPRIGQDGFLRSFQKTTESAWRLQERRRRDLMAGVYFDGFHSCDYCNKNIEEILSEIKNES